MARIDLPTEPLTEYERAVCYYTLPRVTHPITVGLIVIYAVCLLEAFGVLIFGLLWNHPRITQVGSILIAAIVILGIVAFTIRAFLNEIKQRRALAVARGTPNVASGVMDIPDPFGDHALLRHPLHSRGDLFPCTDNEGSILYFVESSPSSAWWKVKDAQDSEVVRVHVEALASSFSLAGGIPGRLSVYSGDKEIAKIRRRFSFTAPNIVITCLHPEPKTYVLHRTGIYCEKRLVGRIYYLHQSLYLDIERAELHNGILGLFITMT